VKHITVAIFLFGSCALSSTALTFVAQGSGNVSHDAELLRRMGTVILLDWRRPGLDSAGLDLAGLDPKSQEFGLDWIQ